MTIKSITSRDNPVFKELRKVAGSASARRQMSQTLLDGVHLCQSYLDNGLLPIRCIVSDSACQNPEVAAIFARCENLGSSCLVFSDALFSSFSQVEQGVALIFLIDIPSHTYVDIDAITGSCLLIDKIQDPGNFGSMLRSAAAAGIGAVFCSTGTAAAWSPKVLRAGMGAHFLLDIVENADLSNLIPELIRHTSRPVIATSPHASHSLYQTDLNKPVAWLFGNEGQGVDDALLALSSHRVSIPQPGKMESLNVAASAAICFFEQVRQAKVRGSIGAGLHHT